LSWCTIEEGLQDSIGNYHPELSLLWNHKFVNDDYALNTSFAGLSVATFTMRRDRPDRDSLGVNASVLWQIADNLLLRLSYNGSFSGSNTNHGETAGVQYRR
jgi:outer membrane autotransporter protein